MERLSVSMDTRQAAEFVGLSLAAFWRAVGSGRLPAPMYPSPRSPRWFADELKAAMEATRALPREQKQTRRLAKLAMDAEAA